MITKGVRHYWGTTRPESLSLKVISIRHDCYGAVPVGPVDVGPQSFIPPEDIWMGNAKDVVNATTDYGNLRSDLFEKGNGAGTETAVVRHKEHITA